jgi:GT2 family glycosyltransferase
MNKKQLAPIIIFAYNRPKKLQNLLKSLELNSELKNSKIIFFIDSSKTSKEKINNEKVLIIFISIFFDLLAFNMPYLKYS